MTGTPVFILSDNVRNAGIAFPPVLVNARQVIGDGHHELRITRFRYVPDFMTCISIASQQVGFFMHRADAAHLRAAPTAARYGVAPRYV